MVKVVKRFQIKNRLGLHARAAALLVQTINQYSAQVKISKDGAVADGRSILSVMTLAAGQGTKVQVEAKGKDAETVVRAIERLIERKFNEPD